MRVNLPVTQTEYQFPADQTLVSVTDLKGRITYCNPAFISVSGFSAGELIGQAHNIVRHPDMPEEAFRDMWATIQARQPWTGLVKNRRKNGDYYWVQANATPMLDGNQITGFLSVRTVPSRDAIQSTEALYSQMNREAKSARKTLTLRSGQVIRNDVFGRLSRLFQPGPVAKLSLIQAVSAGLIVGLDWLSMPVVVTLLAALCAGVVSVWASWSMAIKPLHSLVRDANNLAAGDLSHAVTRGGTGLIGQLQQALMQMSVNLRTVVSDVRQEIDQLSIAVAEIADGNQDLSERTESQASSLEQTAASMEEINGTVQQSAQAASRGSKLAQETTHVTTFSNDAVISVAQSMGSISQSSSKITEIIQLIEGIAFQTNILALNAAVEAARAGDQGRGFAVVASEVRALAQRTATAAKEIKQLIIESSERISAGEEQTGNAIERMRTVLDSVGKVSTVLDEISNASNEQTLGISQINEAIAQMDSITQQNAAMVEELAATAKSLQGQVEAVSSSMRLFRLKTGEATLAQLDAVSMRAANKLLSMN
jgi:aerotaxis receptor